MAISTITKDSGNSKMGSPQTLNNLIDDLNAIIAEINLVTSGLDANELAVLNSASSAEVIASKAVIADANKKINLARLGSGAASASGLLMGVGTSLAPSATSTADSNFVEIRSKSTATSGDSRNHYLRHDIGGIGGSGESVRALTDLTAAASTARGSQISLQAGSAGYVTGLGIGADAQLYVKNSAVPANGTYYAGQSEIYSEGGSSSLAAATQHAIHNFCASGNATGAAKVVNALSFVGTSAADTTKMLSSVSLAELPSGTVGIAVLINGVRHYIPAVVATAWN